MALEKVPEELSKTVLSLYQEEFIYIDIENLQFNLEEQSLIGNIAFRPTPYLKISQDDIFNNTEAVFAANQIGLLLMACYKLQNLQTNNNESYKTLFEQFANRMLVKKQTIEFFKPFYTSKGDHSFVGKIISIKNTNKGILINLNIIIGKQKFFGIDAVIFVVENEVHNVKKLR